MQTVPFSEIRESFTEVTQKVQFSKEPCLLTRNNKPAAGLVPVEYLMLILDIINAENPKKVSKVIEKYMLLLDSSEFKNIQKVLSSSPKPNKQLKSIIKAAEKKFD